MTDSYLKNKKNTVSFVLSLFVFFIHFRIFSAFSSSNLLEKAFSFLFPITQVAVPLFFMISAVFFYRDYSYEVTLQKWKRRFFSLCIPYLIWNTFWFVLGLLGYYTPFGILTGGVQVSFSLKNALQGIFLYGQFEPFWFLCQLIILTALCPAIFFVLKNKWCGIFAIAAYYCLYCLGFRLPEPLFKDSSMVIFYLIGAWIGIHHYDAFTHRVSRKYAVCCLAVFLVCCISIGFLLRNPTWNLAVPASPVIKAISCFCFWRLFDLFSFQSCSPFFEESFAIYSLHSFVGAAIAKILSILLPDSEASLILVAILSFPITILSIYIFVLVLKRYFPRLKTILFGR